MPAISPIYVFLFASFASGVAGVTAYLKSNKEAEWMAAITAFLNSALLGLAMSLIWIRSFKDNVYSLIGICVLIGLMGASGQELILSLVTKSGLTINFSPKKDNKDDDAKP